MKGSQCFSKGYFGFKNDVLAIVREYALKVYYVKLLSLEFDGETLSVSSTWHRGHFEQISEKEKEEFELRIVKSFSHFWRSVRFDRYGLTVDTKHDSVSWRECRWPLSGIPEGLDEKYLRLVDDFWDQCGVGHIERKDTWFANVKDTPKELWGKSQLWLGDALARVRKPPKSKEVIQEKTVWVPPELEG